MYATWLKKSSWLNLYMYVMFGTEQLLKFLLLNSQIHVSWGQIITWHDVLTNSSDVLTNSNDVLTNSNDVLTNSNDVLTNSNDVLTN